MKEEREGEEEREGGREEGEKSEVEMYTQHKLQLKILDQFLLNSVNLILPVTAVTCMFCISQSALNSSSNHASYHVISHNIVGVSRTGAIATHRAILALS